LRNAQKPTAVKPLTKSCNLPKYFKPLFEFWLMLPAQMMNRHYFYTIVKEARRQNKAWASEKSVRCTTLRMLDTPWMRWLIAMRSKLADCMAIRLYDDMTIWRCDYMALHKPTWQLFTALETHLPSAHRVFFFVTHKCQL